MIHLDTILICLGALSCSTIASAQFYTLERSTEPLTVIANSVKQDIEITEVSEMKADIEPTVEMLTEKIEHEPDALFRDKMAK